MKNKSCPIATARVDSALTKVYSIFTFSVITIFLFTPLKEIIFVSAFDFMIRVFLGIKYSPICRMIKFGLKVGNMPTHMVNAGPKKFAAKVGTLFTLIISAGVLLNMPTLSLIVGIVAFLAIGAEVFFNYCLACNIYSYFPDSWK
ncbi:MAG: DUF4395 domain-containing protein [Flavobacteriales bacterium]|nr:DUF4395 domain-containing protein [Flavobacteriales bacterium]